MANNTSFTSRFNRDAAQQKLHHYTKTISSRMFQIESAAIELFQDNISNECDQISVDPNSSRQSCQIGLARSAALDDKEQSDLAASSFPDSQNTLSLDLLSAQSKYYPKSCPEIVNNKLQSILPIPLSNHFRIRGQNCEK